MSEITDYLKDEIVRVRLAKFVGEIVWALGFLISVAALIFRALLLMVPGFSLLFLGLYMSVHYELQRMDYMHALDTITHHDKQ